MGWTESQPTTNDKAPPAEKHESSTWGSIWNAIEHQTGISTIKAIMHTETAENYFHDFKLIDDGRHDFNDSARKQIEKSLNGEQMKHLEEERDDYRNKLLVSAIPSIFAPARPEKGPLMKEFDKQTDEIVKNAEERVQRNMTGEEMKKYRSEVEQYKNAQIASAVLVGMVFKDAPEPGPMMKEYEKRVLAEIDKSGVSWTNKRNDG
jgi:hypothetical protein